VTLSAKHGIIEEGGASDAPEHDNDFDVFSAKEIKPFHEPRLPIRLEERRRYSVSSTD